VAASGSLLAWALVTTLFASAVVLASVTAARAEIFYVYDELNRLFAVVDEQGNAATYTYDAVGNILRIERFDAAQQPGPVRITLVTPTAGKVGTQVQIFGTGFSATPSQNSVAFTGATATATEAAPNRILTSVPSGAATGTITVTAPLGSATSASVFRVLGEFTITPSTASIFVNRPAQFQALEGGAPATNVRWTVNGLPGGDTTVGTVTADGLYTAPPIVPNPSTVTLTATHTDDSTLTASSTVTIMPPQPVFLAAQGVSVGVGAPPATVDKNVTASVSVVVTETAAPTIASATLVSLAVTETAAPTIAAAGLASVQVAESPPAAFAAAGPTAVAIAPVVTVVTPASGARGETLTLTLSGSGFAGATAVTLLLNNATDTTITVANRVVNADGTQVTVDITIGASAPLGDRVVRVTTPGGSSTAAGTGGNLFTVQ
jgi:YD repeat-containing protein